MPARQNDGVLVAGSINTDLVVLVERAPRAGETVSGNSFTVFGGGKGANQAVASARSGSRTAMLGAVGNDDFGRQRLASLAEEGIETTRVSTAHDAPSGVALILVENSGENRIAYVPGAALTVSADHVLATLDMVRPSVLLTTLELPMDALLPLLRAAVDGGVTTILNATPEPSKVTANLALAQILIANETEARDLLGGQQSSWSESADALRALGPECVLITLGKAGAVLADSDGFEEISAPEVEVVDTTGAGDALCGVFAAEIAKGASRLEAARTGVLAGSIAVTKHGAQQSMPTRSEIESFRQLINRTQS